MEDCHQMSQSEKWTVIFGPTFKAWLSDQPREVQVRMLQSIRLLQQVGPNLARPYADTVQGSKFSQMKELRVQIAGRPFRAFYAFDPLRQAVVLCAGNKTGKGRFYAEMISLADNEFEKYLTNLATHHE